MKPQVPLIETNEIKVYLCEVNGVIYKITFFKNEYELIGRFKSRKMKSEVYEKTHSELSELEKEVVICHP